METVSVRINEVILYVSDLKQSLNNEYLNDLNNLKIVCSFSLQIFQLPFNEFLIVIHTHLVTIKFVEINDLQKITFK